MKDAMLYAALILFTIGAIWQLQRMNRRLTQLQGIIRELYSRDEMLKGHLCAVESSVSGLHTSYKYPLEKSREHMFLRWRDFARLCFGERRGAPEREQSAD